MTIRPEQVACIVLAAGRSARFGIDDKLAAKLAGRPLLHHVLTMLDGFAFARKVVVCRPESPSSAEFGFDRIELTSPDALQSDSLRAGLDALEGIGVDAVLVALGDMPVVSAAHVERLLERFDEHDRTCVVGSEHAGRHQPPALFGVDHFATLRAITGDQGARALLRHGLSVNAGGSELVDIDSPADLAQARKAPG